MPGGNATLGLLQSNTFSDTTNYGVRAREELKLTPNLTAVAGIGWETTHLKGINTVYNYGTSPMSERRRSTPIDRRPAIPEHRARIRAALQAESRVAVPGACRHRIRHAAGRQPLRPLERSERQQYAAQDADRTSVTTSASTGRRTTRSNSARPASTNSSSNELVTQATPGRRTQCKLHVQRARNRSIAASSWPPTGSSIPAGGSRPPTPISTRSTRNTPRTSSTARRSASTAPATRSPASRRTN